MGEVNPEQLSFDITSKLKTSETRQTPEPQTRQEKLAAARRVKRRDLILRGLDLIALANSKGSFAYQLEKQERDYKSHKRAHSISEKYYKADAEAEYANQEQLDSLAANTFDKACFYCVEPKKDCFIDTLPADSIYRYVYGIEVYFRHAIDRRKFKKELEVNLGAVCFPLFLSQKTHSKQKDNPARE